MRETNKGVVNMLKKLIKRMFSRKTTLKQKQSMCDYLDQLQAKRMEGMKLI